MALMEMHAMTLQQQCGIAFAFTALALSLICFSFHAFTAGYIAGGAAIFAGLGVGFTRGP